MGGNILPDPTVGCVVTEENQKILIALQNSLFKAGKIPPNAKLCQIIITPECDIAQNKMVKMTVDDDEHVIHRVVYALFYPLADSITDEKKKFHERGKEAKHLIGPLWYENKKWFLVGHFSSLSMQSQDKITGETLFTLKRDILFDLQSKTANHVNRLGTQLLS